MSDKIRLTIVDPDGISPTEVGCPLDWSVDRLVNDFVAKSGLPKKQGLNTISYSAINKRTNTLLPADKTIKEADLQEGDTIRLRKNLIGL